jgi:hypothetical protein
MINRETIISRLAVSPSVRSVIIALLCAALLLLGYLFDLSKLALQLSDARQVENHLTRQFQMVFIKQGDLENKKIV